MVSTNIVREAIEELAKKFKYKKLPSSLSHIMRMVYSKCTNGLDDTGLDAILYSALGSQICNGYNRVVIWDYGAYVEFSENQKLSDFVIAKGQGYRETEKYTSCKYSWLNPSRMDNTKIYKQKHIVDYADYKVGMYYVSVFDVSRKAPN